MNIDLPPLPYKKDALEPHISSENLSLHYDRQKAYIANLNKIEYVQSLGYVAIEQIVLDAIEMEDEYLYNQAAQAWAHAFFFNCLKEDGGGPPTGKIATLIKRDFHNYDTFKKKFVEESKTLFGSGWLWLVYNPMMDRLQVFIGKDSEAPFPFKLVPILVVDLWEHSYLLDYDNDRAKYVQSMLDKCINWTFVNDNCQRARL